MCRRFHFLFTIVRLIRFPQATFGRHRRLFVCSVGMCRWPSTYGRMISSRVRFSHNKFFFCIMPRRLSLGGSFDKLLVNDGSVDGSVDTHGDDIWSCPYFNPVLNTSSPETRF